MMFANILLFMLLQINSKQQFYVLQQLVEQMPFLHCRLVGRFVGLPHYPIMLQAYRYRILSSCHHEVRTISSSIVVLTFNRCQALPSYLRCTLLVYSCKYFFCTILSIVSELFKIVFQILTQLLIVQTFSLEFPAIHLDYH